MARPEQKTGGIDAGKQPCQSTVVLQKKRAILAKRLLAAANKALKAGDVETAVKASAQFEKLYQFDVKTGVIEVQKLEKLTTSPKLKLHQGGAIESQREQLLAGIRAARAGGRDTGGHAGGSGVDPGVSGVG